MLFEIPNKRDLSVKKNREASPLAAVPFPVYDVQGNMNSIQSFNNWLHKWGRASIKSISQQMTKIKAQKLTITEAIRNDHLAFAGCGISPWVLARDCINTPSRMARLFMAYAFILFKSQVYCNRIRRLSLSRDKYTLNVYDSEIVDYDKILFAHAKDSMSLKISMAKDLNDPNINTLEHDLFDRDLMDLSTYHVSNSVHQQMAILASLHGLIYETLSPEKLRLSSHPLVKY
ncbi:hypothetical protein FISHEDRAFT_59787 [Fistulina hepatica ATCC 64428]|uniref:Uncharacterized protein n=1 Tax=Fistulina hepatica ATCC 64428 TaxID=1128425 RepID=A0A0D7A923_9AGAR|nr:hypothetical protein FISHEDRAFT_59787 [Fistulina hepatica ATCC 64428]